MASGITLDADQNKEFVEDQLKEWGNSGLDIKYLSKKDQRGIYTTGRT